MRTTANIPLHVPGLDGPADDPFCLTCDCERVQGEVRDLAGALSSAALAEYGEALRPALLRAVREFRRRAREHVAQVEGPGGLYDSIAETAPRLEPCLACLCREHAELDRWFDELEQKLLAFRPTDGAVIDELRRWADRLAHWVERHQDSARQLASAAAVATS
jgi:hypothetical protein